LRGNFKQGNRAVSDVACQAGGGAPSNQSQQQDARLKEVADEVEMLVLKMVTAAGSSLEGQKAASEHAELSAKLLPRLIALDQSSAIQTSALKCICALSASKEMQKQLTNSGALWRLLLSITAEPDDDGVQTSKDEAIQAALAAGVKGDVDQSDDEARKPNKQGSKSSVTKSKMMDVMNSIGGRKPAAKTVQTVRRTRDRRQWAAEALARLGGYCKKKARDRKLHSAVHFKGVVTGEVFGSVGTVGSGSRCFPEVH